VQLSYSKEEEKEEGIDSLLEKLRSEEDFFLTTLPRMIRNDPDKVKFTMFEQSKELVGNYGSIRVKLLKKAFRVIFDNLITKTTKVGVAYF
jgi:hypothetical protein